MASNLKWFKSSHSSNEGPDCIEVAIAPTPTHTTVRVRDSKHRDGAQVTFTDVTWADFVAFATER